MVTMYTRKVCLHIYELASDYSILYLQSMPLHCEEFGLRGQTGLYTTAERYCQNASLHCLRFDGMLRTQHIHDTIRSQQ